MRQVFWLIKRPKGTVRKVISGSHALALMTSVTLSEAKVIVATFPHRLAIIITVQKLRSLVEALVPYVNVVQ